MDESWIAPLATGDPEAAWDRFIERYRALIFASIRHFTVDHDEVMDVFARICQAFRQNDFARLRQCAARFDPARPLSTWLVVVVRNITIDWFRHRDGRPRLGSLAASLPLRQQRIFEYIFLEHRTHIETYELLRAGDEQGLSFGEFLRELNAAYRAASTRVRSTLLDEPSGRIPANASAGIEPDAAAIEEQRRILGEVLETLAPDDRLAVQLYVVDEMPADQVARALGFADRKTVYNRVYRALAAMRRRLEAMGIAREDL